MRTSALRFVTIALILSPSFACDRSPEKLEFVPPSKPVADVVVSSDPSADAGKNKTIKADKEELPLGLIPGPGTKMRYLDGKALTAFYENVFPKRDYGFEICANITDLSKLPAEASACTESIFNASEGPSMGTFAMNLPQSARGAQNVQASENLTLNYMRTLRAGLARECAYLVKTERAKLKANDGAANKLVKGNAPKAADFDEFFRTILGLKGTNIKVDVGSADYVSAFDTIVGTATAANKEKAADEAYLGICIALAMNPQVIIY